MEAAATQELNEDKHPMFHSKRIQLADTTKQEVHPREHNIASCCRRRGVRLITLTSEPLTYAEAPQFLRKFVFKKPTTDAEEEINFTSGNDCVLALTKPVA